jgi:hypothetical protein
LKLRTENLYQKKMFLKKKWGGDAGSFSLIFFKDLSNRKRGTRAFRKDCTNFQYSIDFFLLTVIFLQSIQRFVPNSLNKRYAFSLVVLNLIQDG